MALAAFALFLITLLFYFLPFRGRGRAKSAPQLYFIGMGALVGLCGFDLLPELVEMGGTRTLSTVVAIWIVYCLMHLWHVGAHHSHHAHEAVHEGVHAHTVSWPFILSLAAHSFADGMLIAVSTGFTNNLLRTVLIALAIHKAYEALTVGSVVISQKLSRHRLWQFSAIYLAAFPLGAALTAGARNWCVATCGPQTLLNATVIILSLSLGSLLGCLVFDFVLPSLKKFINHRASLAWFSLGLVMTIFLVHLTH